MDCVVVRSRYVEDEGALCFLAGSLPISDASRIGRHVHVCSLSSLIHSHAHHSILLCISPILNSICGDTWLLIDPFPFLFPQSAVVALSCPPCSEDGYIQRKLSIMPLHTHWTLSWSLNMVDCPDFSVMISPLTTWHSGVRYAGYNNSLSHRLLNEG